MSLAWYIKRHLNIRSWFPFYKVSKWSIGSSTDRILKVVVKEMIHFISCQFGQILRVHTFFPHISALHLDVNAYTSYVTSLINTLLQSSKFLTMLTTHVQCYKLDRRTRWTVYLHVRRFPETLRWDTTCWICVPCQAAILKSNISFVHSDCYKLLGRSGWLF